MPMGKKVPCTAGCGASGCFWSDPAGRCPECRKIVCKGCARRFTPNRRNPTQSCHTCRGKKKYRESRIEVSLC
jgi:hypothetical protein